MRNTLTRDYVACAHDLLIPLSQASRLQRRPMVSHYYLQQHQTSSVAQDTRLSTKGTP